MTVPNPHNSHAVMSRTLLSITDYMALFNLPRSTAQDRIRRLPPGVRVKVGKLVRVDADKLQAWLDAGGDLANAEENLT